MSAIAGGLAPALQLVDAILQPLLAQFAKLLELWRRLNAIVGSPYVNAATRIRALTAASEGNAQVRAGRLQQGIAGEVQGAVNRAAGGGQSVTNSSSSTAVTQNNSFFGGVGQSVSDALGEALRKGRLAVQGGAR